MSMDSRAIGFPVINGLLVATTVEGGPKNLRVSLILPSKL